MNLGVVDARQVDGRDGAALTDGDPRALSGRYDDLKLVALA